MNQKPILAIITCCAILFAFNLTIIHPSISFFATNPSSSIIKVPEDYTKIQWAIGNATIGATILVANGTYNEHLTINQSITLIGAGNNLTILNGTIADTAIQITANNVTIKGFSIQRFYIGIVINQSQNIYITENQITQIWTKGATYILDSKNITLNKNTLTHSSSAGVNMLKSNMTKFSQNIISHNDGVGIYFENCTDFTATDNQIESNGGDAICCTYAHNLYIARNTFALNDYRGIWAAHSSGKAFHNNFVRNRENARSIQSNITWDDGYPSGGNFWSNYTGSDAYFGKEQNLSGSDGVGDVPFTTPQEGEQDKYPLMGNFTTQTVNIDAQNYTVDFVSNSIINNLQVNQSEKSLYFTINNPNKPEGFCRVTIPTNLMWCDDQNQWLVKINGTLIDRTIIENGNYTHIYFTFTQGIHIAKITATYIVPEIIPLVFIFFLSWAILVAVYLIHENSHTQIKTKNKHLQKLMKTSNNAHTKHTRKHDDTS
jgi:parallel beta-helix repeat protein